MKAYEIHDFGKTGTLTLVDRPVPTPKSGEALVKIRATGLNARDLSIMGGTQLGHTIPLTHVPLSDMAGDVIEVGDGEIYATAGNEENCHAADGYLERTSNPDGDRQDLSHVANQGNNHRYMLTGQK